MRRVTIVAVLLFLGPAMVFPQIPFQALALGADAQIVALLLISDITVTLLLAPLMGTLSDRIGGRIVVAGGLAFGCAGFALLAIADTVALMFLARMLMGVSMAVRPALQTFAVAGVPPRDRVAGLAGINGALALAYVIGPTLASLWFWIDGTGFSVISLLACTVSLVAVGAAMILLRSAPHNASDHSRKAPSRPAITAPPHDSCAVRLYAVCQGIVAFGFSVMTATIGVWSAATLSWEAQDLSFALIGAGLAGALSLFGPTSYLARRLGDHTLAIGAMTTMLAGFLLLIGAALSIQAIAAICLMAAGSAVALSCLQNMLSSITPAHAQGSVFGTTLSVTSLARIVGPLWGGFSLAHLGLSMPNVSGVIVLLLAIAALGRFVLVRSAGRTVP